MADPLAAVALKSALAGLPVYTGPLQSLETWLAAVTKTFLGVQLQDDVKFGILRSKLQGPMNLWLNGLTDVQARTWDTVEEALRARFRRRLQDDEWFTAMRAAKQKDHEGLDTYELRLQELFALRPQLTVAEKIRYLLLGLKS